MNTNDTARLFFALWPDHRVRQSLARAQQAWQWPGGAALVPAAKLHLTLHFLGDVATDRLEALVRGVPSPPPPFELDVGVPAMWRGGVAVLAPWGVPPALHTLHAALAAHLQALQLSVESRPWKPHVTLARKADAARAPEDPPAVRWAVNGYALVRSRLGPQGGYEVLARFA